jgi:hypothetical protein
VRDVIGATLHTLGYLMVTGSAVVLLMRYVP